MKCSLLLMLSFFSLAGYSLPQKSLLGCQGNAFSPDVDIPAPTAADYIQDGLVAMWDAIENAGYGLHDSLSESLVNLADSEMGDLALPASSWKITDSAVVKLTDSATLFRSYPSKAWYEEYMMNDNGWCAEIVCNVTRGSNTNPGMVGLAQACGIIYAYDNYNLFGAQSHNTFNGIGTSSTTTWIRPFYPGNELHYLASNVAISQKTVIWADERSATQQGGGMTGTQYYAYNRNIISIGCTYSSEFPQLAGWTFCAVRIYNRPLTDDEISHNYRLDKKRFGL